jgi:hypothetical protein
MRRYTNGDARRQPTRPRRTRGRHASSRARNMCLSGASHTDISGSHLRAVFTQHAIPAPRCKVYIRCLGNVDIEASSSTHIPQGGGGGCGQGEWRAWPARGWERRRRMQYHPLQGHSSACHPRRWRRRQYGRKVRPVRVCPIAHRQARRVTHHDVTDAKHTHTRHQTCFILAAAARAARDHPTSIHPRAPFCTFALPLAMLIHRCDAGARSIHRQARVDCCSWEAGPPWACRGHGACSRPTAPSRHA